MNDAIEDVFASDTLTPPTARIRTRIPETEELKRVRSKIERIRENLGNGIRELSELHDTREYKVMGYMTFEQCCKAEFGLSRNYAYRLVNMYRLNTRLSAHFVANWQQNEGNGSGVSGALIAQINLNECQARELLLCTDEHLQIAIYERAKEINRLKVKPPGKAGSFWKAGRLTASDIKMAREELADKCVPVEPSPVPEGSTTVSAPVPSFSESLPCIFPDSILQGIGEMPLELTQGIRPISFKDNKENKENNPQNLSFETALFMVESPDDFMVIGRMEDGSQGEMWVPIADVPVLVIDRLVMMRKAGMK